MLNIKRKAGRWAALAACVPLAFLLLQSCHRSHSGDLYKPAAPKLDTASERNKIPIEKGTLHLGDANHTMEKVGTELMIVPGLEAYGVIGGVRVWLDNSSDYALLGTDNGIVPDGSFAVVCREGTTWFGDKLSVREQTSWANPDEFVIRLSGRLTDIKSGRTSRCTFRLTGSQIFAGTSEFRIEGDRAYLEGSLGARTYNQVIDIISDHPKVKTIVSVNVPGSVDDGVNIRTGTLLREHGFNTIVAKGGLISSGGVDLFCAGVKRTIEKGARVGIHSWGGDDMTGASLPENHPAHKPLIGYLNKMLGAPLGSEFYFRTLKAAPASGMHYLSRNEMARWKLETNPTYAPPALEKIPIEKSRVTWGSNSFTAEKIGEAEETIPTVGRFEGIKLYPADGSSGYVMLSSDNGILPNGKTVLMVSEDKTYRAENLHMREKNSDIHPHESVIMLTGEATEPIGGEKTPVTVTLTESQIRGGTSEFRIEKNKAYLTGELGTRTFNQVIDLIRNRPEVKTIVEVDVPGSIDDGTNVKTGTLLRDHAFHTVVAENGEIYSGGVDLFCAGVTRTLEKDAVVGIHSWADEEGNQGAALPRNDPRHNVLIEYLTGMLGAEKGRGFYFHTLHAAPPEGIHEMTEKEIFQWGIATP